MSIAARAGCSVRAVIFCTTSFCLSYFRSLSDASFRCKCIIASDLCTLCSTYYCTCVSDLSKYCVHLLGKEGLGPVRGGFPISYYVVYRAVMAVGVGILCNSGDFAIWYFVLLAIMSDFLFHTLKVSCQSL